GPSVQQPNRDTHRMSPDHIPSGGSPDAIAVRDVAALLRLAGQMGASRSHPRHWRLGLLGGIPQRFPAAAAASLTFKTGAPDEPAAGLVSLVETGFKSEPQRLALVREFNTAPLGDPLGRLMLQQFQAQRLPALTCLRGDLVELSAWQTDDH